MSKYKCSVSDRQGNLHKKEYIASNHSELISLIKSDGLIPVEIKGKDHEKGARYSGSTILDFTSSLSLMMDAGLSVKDCLAMSGNTMTRSKTMNLSRAISRGLEKGMSFHEALSSSCLNLPPLYSGMVRIGEKIGSLKQVFLELKIYLEERKKFKDMMTGAMIYPVFVLIMVIIASLLAAIFVIPGIQEVLSGFGSSSDQLTDLLLKIENFRILILWFIPAVAILIMATVILRKYHSGFSHFIDYLILKIPFLKSMISDQAFYNILYALELLTKSGIPLEEAFLESENITGNSKIKMELQNIRKLIIKGEKLSIAFNNSPSFPPRIGQWIAFGESTGQVEMIFGQLKDFYKGIIEKRMKIIMTMIEPAMIILIGIILIIFVLNIVIPIVTLYGSVL